MPSAVLYNRVIRRGVAGMAAVAALGLTAAGTPPASLTPARAPVTAALNLVATQAAILMNGTFTPDVTPAFEAAVTYNYLLPLVGSGYTTVPLTTPESLWPVSGLNTLTYNDSTRVGYQLLDAKYQQIVAQNSTDGAPNTPMLVFGYSQSAFIASLFDQGLADERSGGGTVPPTTFVLVGNTNIPNGGLMSRFGGLGLTPWTPIVYAPTQTGSPTYDVCRQYDPFCDFPAYPLDALSVVNTLMGYLLHFTLPISGNFPWMTPIINILNKLITPISLNPASPNYVKPIVSTYQDTTYEFGPTAKLPILQPLYLLGLSKLANALDPVLRPLIEAGYARTTSFGVPTPAAFSIPPDLGAALKQSWQALRHLVIPAIPGPTPSVVGVNATNPTPAAAAVPATASVVATATRPGPHKPTTPPATDPTTAAWQAAKTTAGHPTAPASAASRATADRHAA